MDYPILNRAPDVAQAVVPHGIDASGRAVPAPVGTPIAGSKQRLTSLASAQTLTVPAGARSARLQALAQNVRWWDDGSTPTASQGHQLLAGQTVEYGGGFEGLSALRIIEEAASAVLNVTYYS